MLSVLHRTAGPQYFRAVPVIHLAVPVRVCCLNDNERWRGAAISAECTPRKQPLLSSVWPSCSFVIEVTFVWVFMSSRPDKIKNTYSYSLSQAALQHLRFLDFFSTVCLLFHVRLVSLTAEVDNQHLSAECRLSLWETRSYAQLYMWPPTHTRTRCRFGSLPCRLIVWHLTRSQAIEF